MLAPCIDAGKGEVYSQLYRLGAEPPGFGAVTSELRLLPAPLLDLVSVQAGEARAVIAGTGADRHFAD